MRRVKAQSVKKRTQTGEVWKRKGKMTKKEDGEGVADSIDGQKGFVPGCK